MKKIIVLSGSTVLSSIWPVVQGIVHVKFMMPDSFHPGMMILFRLLSPIVCGLIIGSDICAIFHSPEERGHVFICFIFLFINVFFLVWHICFRVSRVPVYNILTAVLLFGGMVFSIRYHQECDADWQTEK